MSVLHQNVPITAGQSASVEVDITDRVICSVEIPTGYTGTAVSFAAAQRSTADGGVYVPVIDKSGAEITLTVAAAKVCIMDPYFTRAFRNIKLVSGTNAAPVVQAAGAVLNISTMEDDSV